ncbi:transcriptional regulator [Desulfuromonas versatilis]|uniref:Transcriptional regulator n=1 Tax=Desulfuromonas versatilis TaxID=2802975 RepID=A0ABM8HXF9_9BACT|nr:helix-turn-helix transcriptional regulator [Desulfuromonas versatilis]BCR05266.1 transcriptional regulator [Desulfuromonas versatilis]
MLELLEDKTDAQAVAEFQEAYQAGREFVVPAEILRRELDGESPVKSWREHRGLTQQDLADKAGNSKPYLSQIEPGKRQGTVDTLAATATATATASALGVPLEVVTD